MPTISDMTPGLCDAIGETSLLSAAEELELGRRIQSGDAEARDKLVMANMRFAIKIAGNFHTKWKAEKEDVIGSAIEGLIEAANRFDPTTGGRFTTYAKYWIDYRIRQYLNQMVPLIHVPAGQINMVRELHRDLDKEAKAQNDYTLTEERLAEQRGIKSDLVGAVKSAFTVVAADDVSIYEDMAAQDRDNAADVLGPELLAAIDALPEMHCDIIRRFFGIGCQPQTLQHIAQIRVLSRERIRQLKNEGLEMLKEWGAGSATQRGD